jgi:hypothetical protein
MRVQSVEMARAAFNALAFLPARSKFKQARIEMSEHGIRFTATDGIAAGQDYVTPAEPWNYYPVTAYVDRDGLAALDKGGRDDKSSKARIGVGTFDIKPDDGIIFTGSDGAQTAVLTSPAEDDMWAQLDEIFTYHEQREPYLPDTICFDPQVLNRFGKVKADKDGRMMDLKLTGDKLEPVLVKVGPTFRGIIMPIDRGVNAKNIGEDGLW